VDAVVHLGEIVGDPACSLNESFTIETNYMATQRIVDECMRQRTKRLIFASSCSVYGQNDEEVNEESELNPVSLYARCKIESEKAILSSSYNYVSPTILRLSTVHGKSFRNRYDLVVNLLTAKALIDGKIGIFGGEQWRPFVSVLDVCQGIVLILRSDRRKVRNQIFNLGDSRENYQITKIGDIIKEVIPAVNVEVVEDKEDARNYRVSFDKIRNTLGYSAEWNVRDSVKELVEAYHVDRDFLDYKNPKYNNYLSLKM
jgi:nucleoside-diphosphate-sugar epimerase